MSEWGVDQLKEHLEKRIDAIEVSNDKRFAAQEKAVETAFEAAKEAVTKSEVAVEKRADAVYVTIGKLTDSLITVMPRAEAEQRYNALSEKMTEVTDRVNRTEGKSTGLAAGWGYLVGAIALSATIITVTLALIRG